MTSFVFPALFLLAGGQPPTDAAVQPPARAADAAPAAEPKMICRYEHVTGSRLSRQKVCRPEGQSGMDQETALQRELQRNGDFREAPGTFGN